MKQTLGTRFVSLALAGSLAFSLPLSALADTYDLTKGDIEITVEKHKNADGTETDEEDVWVRQTSTEKNKDTKEYLSEEASKDVDEEKAKTEKQIEVPKAENLTENSNLTIIDSSKTEKTEDEKAEEKKKIEDAKKEDTQTRVYDIAKGLLQKTPLVIKQTDSDTKSTTNTIEVKSTDKGTKAEFTVQDINIEYKQYSSTKTAGIELNGSDAEITLSGNNTLNGCNVHISGEGGSVTFQDDGKENTGNETGADTLTIKKSSTGIGTNSEEDISGNLAVTAQGNSIINIQNENYYGASGIGTSRGKNISGSLTVEAKDNASITATAGNGGSGIGTGSTGTLTGTLTVINSGSGTITANSGDFAAGIGIGQAPDQGANAIDGGTIRVSNTGTGSIVACGDNGTGIGTGKKSHIQNKGKIEINVESGSVEANVTGNGRNINADIGTGEKGNITGGSQIVVNVTGGKLTTQTRCGIGTGSEGDLNGGSKITVNNSGTGTMDLSTVGSVGSISADSAVEVNVVDSSINIRKGYVIGSRGDGDEKMDGTVNVKVTNGSITGSGNIGSSHDLGGVVNLVVDHGSVSCGYIGAESDLDGTVNILLNDGHVEASWDNSNHGQAGTVIGGSNNMNGTVNISGAGTVIAKNTSTEETAGTAIGAGNNMNGTITIGDDVDVTATGTYNTFGDEYGEWIYPYLADPTSVTTDMVLKKAASIGAGATGAMNGVIKILDRAKVHLSLINNHTQQTIAGYMGGGSPSLELDYAYQTDEHGEYVLDEDGYEIPLISEDGKSYLYNVITVEHPDGENAQYIVAHTATVSTDADETKNVEETDRDRTDGYLGNWSWETLKQKIHFTAGQTAPTTSTNGEYQNGSLTILCDHDPDTRPAVPEDQTNTGVIESTSEEAGRRWYWVTALLDADENVGYTYQQIGSNLIVNADEAAQAAVLHVLLTGWAEHTDVQSITFVTGGKATTLYADKILAQVPGEHLTLTHEGTAASLAVDGTDYTALLGEAAA